MPAYAERHSQDAKAALFRGAIDENKTVAKVLRDATARILMLTPELQAELAAIPYSYATRLVADEKHRRAAVRHDSTDAVDVARQAAAAAARHAKTELQRIESRRKTTPATAGELKAVMDLADRAMKLQRACDDPTPPRPPGRPPTQKTPEPKPPQGFIARLAAGPPTEDDETETEQPGQPERLQGNEEPPRTNTLNNNTTTQSSSAVRLRAAIGSEKRAVSEG